MTSTTETGIRERVDALDWSELAAQLDGRGFAVTAPLLSGDECAELADLFDGGRFRSTVEMARHRVGMRHGVSTLHGGHRTALGVIFHDAR